MAKNNRTVDRIQAVWNKLGGEQGVDRLLNGELQLIPIAKAVNSALAEFFTTKKGELYVQKAYVNESFTKRVLPYHDDKATADISSCDFIEPPRSMSDSNIIKEYFGGKEVAKKNAFTLNQVKAFIQAQPNGESGNLLNDGYANIFYCIGEGDKMFAVVVDWSSVHEWWQVSVWKLDGISTGSAFRRVFRNKR
jgi:hypothetical protein